MQKNRVTSPMGRAASEPCSSTITIGVELASISCTMPTKWPIATLKNTTGLDDWSGAPVVLPSSAAMLPRGSFTLRGELMHCFISYRVATEGNQSSAETFCPAALSSLESPPLHIAHP